MKRLFFSLLAVFISFGTMQAQRIEVVDTEGNPIPLVYLLTEEGNLVGSTDMNGVLADAKGEKTSPSSTAYPHSHPPCAVPS